jgi:hypothetical protein
MNHLMVIYPIETCSGKDNKKFWEELVAYFPSIRMDRRENDASNSSSLPQERLYRVVT